MQRSAAPVSPPPPPPPPRRRAPSHPRHAHGRASTPEASSKALSNQFHPHRAKIALRGELHPSSCTSNDV
eukprot:6203983-Pleurochrysis_carterae.AAC.2